MQYTSRLTQAARWANISLQQAKTCRSSTTICHPSIAVAYRLSLLIRRPPTRGLSGRRFTAYAVCLERGAHGAAKYGGGSLTALPIIETQAGDVSLTSRRMSFRSQTQIFLKASCSGPASCRLSTRVSRFPVSAAMHRSKRRRRSPVPLLIRSQYREPQSFAQFGSDLDADTKARLSQGERVVEVLKQGRNQPIDVEKQVCILYAVINNYLMDVPVERVSLYEGLYARLDAQHADILETIRTTGKFEKETEEKFCAALETIYPAIFLPGE